MVEGEALCRPGRDQTGEGTCPAGREDEADKQMQSTAASLAAVDEWIDRQAWD
ncbi:hypothetical protein GCM10011504_31860 [Siccirubricoccus deserti]|uniref:Uncharacterized protein n=1 Tax=Siccirubricoccus deserti TaxID=2013562 RepID=A0A9X0QZD1_9PROT|nr:hypothetical protein [Siccirubricoccus deserti]MBC4016685.1 hypothetical protein [Siccirubricoccus deserti]GGC51090.1 hypothetical protein GCM10011504_31860 [Siccirubricoccus deserti]